MFEILNSSESTGLLALSVIGWIFRRM